MTSAPGTPSHPSPENHRSRLAAAKDTTPEERRALLEAARREARDRRASRPVPARGTRRALAALAAVPFTAGVVAAYLPPGGAAALAVQAAGAAALLGGLLALRRATGETAERAAADLDERELRERHGSLASSYLGVLCCVAVVFLLAIADGPLLDVAAWEPLILGTLGTAVLLPSAVLAWTRPDTVPDEP